MEEKNDIKIGGFTVDLFITEDGNLGITVYEPNKPSQDDGTKCVDIFVDKNNIQQISKG